jgi:arylsulfatase A-like enzyme
MPTCLELAGLPPEPRVAGASFAPLLRGKTQALRGPLFSECRNWSMVREGRWKLVVEDDAYEPTLLFDMQADPHELKNLVGSPEHAEVVAELRGRIAEWQARCTLEPA